jgi:hypothetical protein
MFLQASVLVLAAALTAWATPCRAAGVIIGPLCLDGCRLDRRTPNGPRPPPPVDESLTSTGSVASDDWSSSTNAFRSPTRLRPVLKPKRES